MADDEYQAFVADIRRVGVLAPLDVTANGVVLNGRHRLRAATELALEVVPVRVVAPEDEFGFMVSQALHHRHLSPSQRSALAVQLFDLEGARERSRRRQSNNLRQNRTEVAALPPREKTREAIAKTCGVSPRLVQDAIAVQDFDPALLELVKADKVSVSRAAQHVRRLQAANVPAAPPLPRGPFDLIYADPPWQMGNPDSPYAPEQHYKTMPLDKIATMQVPACAAALLYLWVPNSLIPAGLQVLEAWGFEFKTTWVWRKPSIKLGKWVRTQHETILIGRKGNHPAPHGEDVPSSVIDGPDGPHSQKPHIFYELIERMYPHASKLELFARNTRDGWTSWGNQVPDSEGAA